MGILDWFGDVLDDLTDTAEKAASKYTEAQQSAGEEVKPTAKQKIDHALDNLSGVNRNVTTEQIFVDIDNARATLKKMRACVDEMIGQRKGTSSLDTVYDLSLQSWRGASGDAMRLKLVAAADAQDAMIERLDWGITTMEKAIQDFIDADRTLSYMIQNRKG